MTNDKANVTAVDEVTADGFQVSRFKRLVKAVEATPDREFDMGVIVSRRGCGTVGCAWGNYILRNASQFPGFAMTRTSWGTWNATHDGFGLGDDMYEVAAGHFGITDEEAVSLFGPWSYREASRANVLARLRAFLASKLPDCRPDPHAMRARYAAMSGADLAARTDAAVDAGKLDGVIAQRSLNDELIAFAGLSTPWERAEWETPKLPPTRGDFDAALADAGEAVPA